MNQGKCHQNAMQYGKWDMATRKLYLADQRRPPLVQLCILVLFEENNLFLGHSSFLAYRPVKDKRE